MATMARKAYNPQKIVRANNPALKQPKPVHNTYYPTYLGADGLCHQSSKHANMPEWSPEPSRGQKRGM
jgi:hypothetical protein